MLRLDTYSPDTPPQKVAEVVEAQIGISKSSTTIFSSRTSWSIGSRMK